MKVLKYLRSSHSSAAQGDVTDVHKSSGRKAQSAPTSPTPTNKQQQQHPEDTKPSSSFFSRSFRRSKSFTRMRNFFENIANLRGEPKAEPEEGEGKVTLRKKGSTAGERPEDRASVHDDRICEVLHSMLSEQQALFETRDRTRAKNMSIAFFELDTNSLTSIRHNFELVFGELFPKADTKNKTEDETVLKVTATFELRKEARNVDVSLRLSRPDAPNDLEHRQQLPLAGALSIINILQKSQQHSPAKTPPAEPSSLQWTEFVAHVGREQLGKKIEHLARKERNIFESIFEIISTEHSYIQGLRQLYEHSKATERMSVYDQRILFANIEPIYNTQVALLEQLLASFQVDIFMGKVFVILSRFYQEDRFEEYIKYIKDHKERNQVVQQSCLAHLRPLVITPMQRITRYPLLLEAVMSKIKAYVNSEDYVEVTPNTKHSSTQQLEAFQPKRTKKVLTRLRSVFKLQSSDASGDARLATTSASVRHTSSTSAPVIGKHARPRMTSLLSSVEACYSKAKAFADRCNEALSYQEDMRELIELQKRFTNIASLSSIVVTGRRILHQIVATCYELQGFMKIGQKYLLIMLTDLLVVAKVDAKKKDYYVLMAYDSYSNVDVRDGYHQANDMVDGDTKEGEIEVNRMRKAPDVLTVIVESSRARYVRPFILTSQDKRKFLSELKRLKEKTTVEPRA